jgi:NAD(P)H-dependent flavin oxidoreductase YrpB (nitropropane dioxygenase family)
LRTAWTDEWERADHPDPLQMPLQTALVGEAQVRINSAAVQSDSKARELATYFVGQVVGSMDKVQPAKAVVLDMVAEFIDAVEQLEGVVEQ